MEKYFGKPKHKYPLNSAKTYASRRRTASFTPLILSKWNSETKSFDYMVTSEQPFANQYNPYADGWDIEETDQIRSLSGR